MAAELADLDHGYSKSGAKSLVKQEKYLSSTIGRLDPDSFSRSQRRSPGYGFPDCGPHQGPAEYPFARVVDPDVVSDLAGNSIQGW
jgi:hypothetical protein